MSNNLKKAKETLLKENFTCVFYDGKEMLTSHDRGVKPLISLIDRNKKLTGFSGADKVIGKAAAFLYILLDIKEIYASVLSLGAKEVFDKYGIYCEAEVLSDAIINRQKTGFCPMETAVKEISSPEEALNRIKETLKNMQNS